VDGSLFLLKKEKDIAGGVLVLLEGICGIEQS